MWKVFARVFHAVGIRVLMSQQANQGALILERLHALSNLVSQSEKRKRKISTNTFKETCLG